MQITLLLFGILQLQFETSPMRIAAVWLAVTWLTENGYRSWWSDIWGG